MSQATISDATFSANDHRFMARALRLAGKAEGSAHPNPRVGCVIVADDVIVGEGWHEEAGGPHAEVHALRAAGEKARGARCYVTLEPCSHHGRTPPCANALLSAGLAEVVVAMTDPDPRVSGTGIERLREAGVRVRTGLMADAAAALNRGFVSRNTRGRPWVTAKLAASLDGRTALANGVSQWITGPEARADVHRLRARADAVLTGIGTVLADDPSLTARPDVPVKRQPLRVVLDSHLRTPATARLLGLPGDTLILTTTDGVREGARVEHIDAADGRLDLAAVMARLANWPVNEVWVEAGATLSGALLQAGLVDEWILYLAPHILGDGARGLMALPVFTEMAQRQEFLISDVRQTGDDLRLTLRPRA
ncbi:MAG: bifunctional diaminohydroxyphosphoribosylaminopyrimidine deaminase/5-amino-6-(5-phosphoribosylamino)uracil reductase RibD [Pseudomonadota bacterium]